MRSWILLSIFLNFGQGEGSSNQSTTVTNIKFAIDNSDVFQIFLAIVEDGQFKLQIKKFRESSSSNESIEINLLSDLQYLLLILTSIISLETSSFESKVASASVCLLYAHGTCLNWILEKI